MIHVLLDTSIYRKQPRLDSPEFKALGYAARRDCVQIHIPFIIQQEFESHLYHEHKKRVDVAVRSISALAGGKKIESIAPELFQSLNSIREHAEELYGERRQDFITWVSTSKACVHELVGSQAAEAFRAYCYGEPPLKQEKNRKDIPDSFIYQAVKSLRQQCGDDFHFVVEDGSLRAAAEAIGVTVYDSLGAFIGIKEARDCLKNAVIDEHQSIVSERLTDLARANSSTILDKIELLLLGDDYRVIYGDMLPGDLNEIFVSMIGKPDSFQIVGSAQHYGEGLFVLEFSARVELIYEYALERSDALDLMGREGFYVEYLNDHYFNIETTSEFNFSGRLELDFGPDLGMIVTIDDLLHALQDPKISISELEDFEVRA